MNTYLVSGLILLSFVRCYSQAPSEAELRRQAQELTQRMDDVSRQSRLQSAMRKTRGALLIQRNIQAELALDAKQVKSIEDKLQEIRTDARGSRTEIDAITDPQQKLQMMEARQAYADSELDNLASEILSKEQIDQLTAMTLKARFSMGGIEAVIASHDLVPEIGSLKIDQGTIQQFNKVKIEAESEYQRQIRELSDEYRLKVTELRSDMINQALDQLPEDARNFLRDRLGSFDLP